MTQMTEYEVSQYEIDQLIRETFKVSQEGEALLRDVPAEVRSYGKYTDRELQQLVEAGGHADPAFVELELRMNQNLRLMVKFSREMLKQQLHTNVLLGKLLEKLEDK
jgi:hypothetical protein